MPVKPTQEEPKPIAASSLKCTTSLAPGPTVSNLYVLPEETLRQVERANSKVGPRELLALAQDHSFSMQLQANGVDPSGLTREQKYAAWVKLELSKKHQVANSDG